VDLALIGGRARAQVALSVGIFFIAFFAIRADSLHLAGYGGSAVCAVILSSFKHGTWRTVFGVAAFLVLWYFYATIVPNSPVPPVEL